MSAFLSAFKKSDAVSSIDLSDEFDLGEYRLYFALHFFKNNTFRPIRFKNKITFLYVVVEFFRFFFTVLLTFLFGGVFFFVYYFPAKMFLFLTIVIAISLRKQSQDQIRYLRNLHIPCHFCWSAQSYFQLA